MLEINALKKLRLQEEQYILLIDTPVKGFEEQSLLLQGHSFEILPVGSFLGPEKNLPCLQVLEHLWLPNYPKVASRACWAKTLRFCEFDPNTQRYLHWQDGYTLAWITLSEKGHQGRRTDQSGPRIPKMIREYLPISLEQGFLLPDRQNDLTGLLTNLTLEQGFNLVLTTGSTGITSQDIAPQATSRVIERRLHGFEHRMLQASLTETPHGIISRALAGVAKNSLIINLPGNPRAVQTNLTPLLPTLKHTLDKLQDDPTECADQ